MYLLKPTVASLLANSQRRILPNGSLSAVDQADNHPRKLCKQINDECHIAGEIHTLNITTMYHASQTECAIFSLRQTYPHDVLLSGRDTESLSHPPTLHLCRCAELARHGSHRRIQSKQSLAESLLFRTFTSFNHEK